MGYLVIWGGSRCLISWKFLWFTLGLLQSMWLTCVKSLVRCKPLALRCTRKRTLLLRLRLNTCDMYFRLVGLGCSRIGWRPLRTSTSDELADLIGFYDRFIPDFSGKASVLHALKKVVRFVWGTNTRRRWSIWNWPCVKLQYSKFQSFRKNLCWWPTPVTYQPFYING